MPLPLPRSRKALWLLGLAFAALASAGVYLNARPDILFLGFPSMYRFLLAESASQSGVRYHYWSPEKLDSPRAGQPDFSRYKVIYVSGRRSDPLSRPVRRALQEAGEAGSKVIVLPAHDTARLGVGNADFQEEDRWIDDYWRFGGVANMARLLQTSAARYSGQDAEILPPEPTPDDGYYHPESPSLFTTTEDYESWYAGSGRFQQGGPKALIDFADGWRLGMNEATDAIVRAFEDGGFNTAAIFGTAQAAPFALEYRPDILISRKHGRWWLGEQGVEVLEEKLDVPILRGLSLLFTGESFGEYQKTRAGIRDAGLIMGAMVPELDGAIQPTLIEGLDSAWYGRRFEAFRDERIDLLVQRARHWVRLRKLANAEKKVAIFYVSGIGKGRITAAQPQRAAQHAALPGRHAARRLCHLRHPLGRAGIARRDARQGPQRECGTAARPGPLGRTRGRAAAPGGRLRGLVRGTAGGHAGRSNRFLRAAAGRSDDGRARRPAVFCSAQARLRQRGRVAPACARGSNGRQAPAQRQGSPSPSIPCRVLVAARCLAGRRHPQLRHARHARILARTAARPIGRRLVGSHHRPAAQPLRLRHGQRGRGPDREAPRGGGDGQPPDSAGGSRRTHEGRAGDRGSLPRRPAVAGCCAGSSQGTPARTSPLHGRGA